MENENEILRPSIGVLKYSKELRSLRVEVDPGISDYYRSLIPKWIVTRKQMYEPHISVVRKEIIPASNISLWGKYEGEEIEFYYSNIVRFGTVYCWLNVFCEKLEKIRLELGLPVDSIYTRPPDGFAKTFHMTLGNNKPNNVW